MRRIFTLIAVFVIAGMHAQRKVSAKIEELHTLNAKFTSVAPLVASNALMDADVSRAVNKASFAQIDMAVISNIMQSKHETLTLEIPYQGSTIAVELYKVELFNENFHLDSDKAKNIAYEKGLHYRGIVKGNAESVASVNFFNNEMNAIISDASINNLVIGRLSRENNFSDYILYSDSDMRVPNGFNCMVKDDENHSEHDDHGAAPQERNALSIRCVTIYFEVDHDLYLSNNSSTTLTTNWMTSVFNNVQTLFSNEDITTSLKSMFIWTEPDPYFGEQSYDYLFQFNEVRPVFDGDLGQLVGIDPGGLGGVAVTIDGMCSQNNFSYSDVEFNFATVPTFSWTVQVISHELGHLMGSRHTHACAWNGNNTSIDGCGTQAGYEEGNCAMGPIPSPVEKGTIMSYCHLIGGIGINLANGFGPQPASAIYFAVEDASCLSTDCVNTCINTVATIDVSNITTTSATINFTDLGDSTSQWEIAVMPYNSNTANWTPITSTTFNTSSPLTPNTFYKVRIRPICESSTPNSRVEVFATAANWCSGVTITDTGGSANEYDDMEMYVRTMIPDQPNKKIKMQFTQFDLEQDYDYLYIYDGPNTGANELTGGLTGNFSPGTFTSTSPDGSMTIVFTSDQAVTEEGYVALISCEQNLGVDDFGNVIDFTYYPNPTDGIVKILSNTEISNLAVYNVQGRLLYNSDSNALETQVDMTNFASGTYFFKMKFGEKEANFKILKN